MVVLCYHGSVEMQGSWYQLVNIIYCNSEIDGLHLVSLAPSSQSSTVEEYADVTGKM